MIQEAAKVGKVVVILNSDDWLLRKKGFRFMPWDERAEIIMSISGVSDVVNVDDSDGTVCEALMRVRPDFFANGGDRGQTNTPEISLCRELGIKMLWGVGGGKVQSSSDLVSAIKSK
jgi:D-beta-D-heptose 7-phosphate kinase/D-beta-D-heptose 1-phosphate adenosyltransferase